MIYPLSILLVSNLFSRENLKIIIIVLNLNKASLHAWTFEVDRQPHLPRGQHELMLWIERNAEGYLLDNNLYM